MKYLLIVSALLLCFAGAGIGDDVILGNEDGGDTLVFSFAEPTYICHADEGIEYLFISPTKDIRIGIKYSLKTGATEQNKLLSKRLKNGELEGKYLDITIIKYTLIEQEIIDSDFNKRKIKTWKAETLPITEYRNPTQGIWQYNHNLLDVTPN